MRSKCSSGGSRKVAYRKKMLCGGGQKAAHYDVESSLADWVISQRERNITRLLIASRGKQMIQDPDF